VKFIPQELAGVWLIEPEWISDERGSFGRTWCAREFEGRGLNPRLVQCNISTNRRQGTVRGMHFQREPHAEVKLVRCTRGAIFDVIVDLRPGSPTFRLWVAQELSADNHRMFYIPEGFAHGFQTLTDDAEVFYQMSHEFVPGAGDGVRWNDPAIDVRWPLPISVISERDQIWPELP
jgi:dTDP-4-dehydrorhamnose 3,5-epimerase